MWSIKCKVSSHITTCHACHAICRLSPLDAALTLRFVQNTQQHTFKVLRSPRKKATHLLTTAPLLPYETTFDTFTHVREYHEVPRLPRKTTLQPALTPSKRKGFAWFCSFPYRHGEVTRKPENRDETCWRLNASISCETSSK